MDFLELILLLVLILLASNLSLFSVYFFRLYRFLKKIKQKELKNISGEQLAEWLLSLETFYKKSAAVKLAEYFIGYEVCKVDNNYLEIRELIEDEIEQRKNDKIKAED